VNTNSLEGRPLCEAEFDDNLEKYQKEAVAKAFSHYEFLAQHLLNQLSTAK
jgi:hypothetical protein